MTRREAGFSLIEVLVAVAVFAAVSAISVGLLAGALRSKEQGEAALERLAAVQRASALLREDIGQFTPRTARTEEGFVDPRLFAADIDGTEPVRRAGDAREILVLTRTGWANPGGVQPRSTLQRVAWILEDDALYREVRAYPDAAPGLEPRRQLILEGLSAVSLDVLSAGGWSPRARLIAGAETVMTPPDAVRLRYDLAGLGAIEHVALSPSAEAR
ncbi:MAG: type II secretion system minor pseudopilin GspJ [Alphaproteobacteria bacterium]|nr:type II secretion system minor pseudopilin GspJ [Alphaproteobacteria bacterium]